MTSKNTELSIKLLNGIISQYKTIREFARTIEEDPADIFKWRAGTRKINPRAIIKIVKLHKTIQPHDLNADVFPKGLSFKFKGES